jgi:biopolymer transport protein ExbD
LNNYQKELGVPVDTAKIESKDNELQKWVDAAKAWNKEKYQDAGDDEKKDGRLKIAIKADADTPYSDVKNVMASLQRIKQNRYFLITSYKKVED